ncbi:MAG: hypothetical protein MUO33_07120 [Sedimentisphaerales bacterium]|nr:hypothetical protein [Sedimentisphaerales bacterium]
MINKIDAHQIQDVLARQASQQASSAKVLADGGVDISLQVDYASLVNKAMLTEQSDAEAVRRASELLRSGQLESPENVRAAAENIVKFGV